MEGQELTPKDLERIVELLPECELRDKVEHVLRDLARRVALAVPIKVYPFQVE